jgi:hypothetical protein
MHPRFALLAFALLQPACSSSSGVAEPAPAPGKFNLFGFCAKIVACEYPNKVSGNGEPYTLAACVADYSPLAPQMDSTCSDKVVAMACFQMLNTTGWCL